MGMRPGPGIKKEQQKLLVRSLMKSLKIVLAILMMLAVAAPAARVHAQEGAPVLTAVKVYKSVDGNIVVEISGDKSFEYSSYKMPQLQRIVVDLPGSEPAKPDTVQRYKSIIVTNIRVEKKEINSVPVSRVVINLAEDADFESQRDPSDSTKLRVVLRKAAPGTRTAAAAPPASSAKPEALATRPAADPPRPSVGDSTGTVAVTGVKGGADSIEILAGSGIAQFKAFTLQQPGRLVIDISGARSELHSLALPANKFGVTKARLGIFEGKLRIVLDSEKDPFPPFDVVKTAVGLRILPR